MQAKKFPSNYHPSTHSLRTSRPRGFDRYTAADHIWRRGPESNRTNRICNPGHNRFATAPEIHISLTKKGSICFPFCGNWSGKRDLNPRSNSLTTLDFFLVRRRRCTKLCTTSKRLATGAKSLILHQTKKRHQCLLTPSLQSRERTCPANAQGHLQQLTAPCVQP